MSTCSAHIELKVSEDRMLSAWLIVLFQLYDCFLLKSEITSIQQTDIFKL